MPADLHHLRPRNFQLHAKWSLFHHFAHLRKVAGLFIGKRKTHDFVTGEAIDDRAQFAIEKYLAVIDNNHTMTKFLDVLHVMAREHGHDAVFAIVETKELAHAFLAND